MPGIDMELKTESVPCCDWEIVTDSGNAEFSDHIDQGYSEEKYLKG